MNYTEFIKKKGRKTEYHGFHQNELNGNMFPFQAQSVKVALSKGRYAIWADCGLGKTLMEMECAYRCMAHTGKSSLILTPLAVVAQFIDEGQKFGIPVQRYTNQDGIGIYVTNYENLHNVDLSRFDCIVLDESSILKGFDGKTSRRLIDTFSNFSYRFSFSATPAPNDFMELGTQAEFLGICKRTEMLAEYFIHDGGQTSKWRLKKHAKSDFWGWVSGWATMLNKPSDIGFSDDGYDLPGLNISNVLVEVDESTDWQLFRTGHVSATEFNRELKRTLIPRMDKAAQLALEINEPVIIWVSRNDEADYLKKILPDAVEVRGSDKPELKEKRLLGFAKGDFKILITKKKIAQFGLNYQSSNHQIHATVDFSFESTYQAIRRQFRFGQKNVVNVYMITTRTMQNVTGSLDRKMSQFREMQNQMIKNMNSKEKMEYTSSKAVFVSKNATWMHGDCVDRISEIKTGSVGLSIFSPPFAELYVYNDSPKDMGNSRDYNEFVDHFNFLIPELKRVMMPGRNVVVHCMDLPIQKGKEGFIGLRDFSGIILKAFLDQGFIYHSRVTIWKNPVTEMQRTKALGLLHKQVKKDSVMSRVGIPDYLLIFRAPGDNPQPITNTSISVDLWQKYASPVWMDIDYGNTLNSNTKGNDDEKHICPLQLDTIERSIHLWSNPGDTVFTPFGGVGSEVYKAVEMGRVGKGIELKRKYWEIGKRNINESEMKLNQASLF